MAFEVSTLDALAESFDAFLIDQFGVLLDGSGAYGYAPGALRRLSETGKPIVLLSNSGRRSAANEARLTALGFDRASYVTVLSSGEAAHSELSRRIGDTLTGGTRVWLHSRDGDKSPLDGLDLLEAESPTRAGFLLIAGSMTDLIPLQDYRGCLSIAAERGVPCICSNPDVVMLTPSGKHPGAGAIAALYESLGGEVDYIGKPHPMIYTEASRLLPGIRPDRILAIGDSPSHDVAGGRAAGHATALVQTGIHAELGLDDLRALCEAEGAVPDFVIPRFAFEAA